MSFQKEINRLAGTTGLEAQKAANVLAGTSGRELLYALNEIAGTEGKEFNGVIRLISLLNGGDGEKDANIAFAELDLGSINIGGFDSVSIGFSSAFTGEYTQFYDGAGLSY